MALEIALRSLALLLVAPAAVRSCGRSPAVRHLVWSLFLLGLVLLPASTVLLPDLRLPLLPAEEDPLPTVAGAPPPAAGVDDAPAAAALAPGAPEPSPPDRRPAGTRRTSGSGSSPGDRWCSARAAGAS